MKQITFSELTSMASKRASAILRNHRKSCTAAYLRFKSDGTRYYEYKQIKSPTKTWAQCLSIAFKELYRQFTVVVSLSTDEVLQRIREQEEFSAVCEFESRLSYNP
jgi:hypothetical protein